jgi:hypothetical protein
MPAAAGNTTRTVSRQLACEGAVRIPNLLSVCHFYRSRGPVARDWIASWLWRREKKKASVFRLSAPHILHMHLQKGETHIIFNIFSICKPKWLHRVELYYLLYAAPLLIVSLAGPSLDGRGCLHTTPAVVYPFANSNLRCGGKNVMHTVNAVLSVCSADSLGAKTGACECACTPRRDVSVRGGRHGESRRARTERRITLPVPKEAALACESTGRPIFVGFFCRNLDRAGVVVSQSPDQLKKPQSGSCLGKPKSKQHQEPRQAHSSSMQGCNAVHDGHLFFF